MNLEWVSVSRETVRLSRSNAMDVNKMSVGRKDRGGGGTYGRSSAVLPTEPNGEQHWNRFRIDSQRQLTVHHDFQKA